MKELADFPLILPASPNVLRLLLDRVFAETGINPNMVGEADVLSSLLSAVQTGMGHTILPKGDLSDVPGHGSLFALPIEPPVFLIAAVIASIDFPLSRAALLTRGLLMRFVFKLMNEKPPPGAAWIGNAPLSTEPRGR
jgi:LysR family nitrogen assimilation transcriptional regulator